MSNLPTEPTVDDEVFGRWMTRFKQAGGMFISAFVAGALVLAWGDSRYIRIADIDKLDVAHRAKLTEHSIEDKALFATKVEVATAVARLEQHVVAPQHSKTAEVNRLQDLRIRALEDNQAWIASALFKLAKRQGISLPPPPLNGKRPHDEEE